MSDTSPPAGIDPNIDLIDFTNACLEAGRLNDINAFYLVAVAQIESGIKNIPAAGSSGFGPFQILAETWSEFKDRLDLTDDDRFDPFAQPFVAAKIAADGTKALLSVLPSNRRPTPYELYFSHLFGVRGSKVILGGSSTRSIRDALIEVHAANPDPGARADAVIKANKSLLASGDTPRSVGGVLNEVTTRMDEAFAKALPKDVLKQIDPDLTRELVIKTTSGNTTYWVVNLIGPEEGGQSIIKRTDGQQPGIILSDTTVFPIKATDKIPADVAAALNKASPGDLPTPTGPGGNPPKPTDDISAKVFAAAKAFLGHDTSNVPGTEHGNLACAWAVNEVVRLALGKPISGGNHNGLGTGELFNVLQKRHMKLNSASEAKPGTIIISPTPPGGPHGHVGIVGDNSADDTHIFSNSSGSKKFAQKFTLKSWRVHYAGKGLQVLFFALNRNQF